MRRFLKIYQNFLYFAPYWAPILYLNKSESPSVIFPTKFGWNWPRRKNWHRMEAKRMTDTAPWQLSSHEFWPGELKMSFWKTNNLWTMWFCYFLFMFRCCWSHTL